MKKLNITKEQFNKSRYFKNKYGKLAYVSESGRLFKTNKGKVLMFEESQPESPASDYDDEEWDDEENNDRWVWRRYITGTAPMSHNGKHSHYENKCVKESKVFETIDECSEDMLQNFTETNSDSNNDDIWGPLWFSASDGDLEYGQIGEEPWNTTKITYYSIGGSDDRGIGKIVMEHDVADYPMQIWVVEKA